MRQWLRKARVTFTGAATGFVVNPLPVVRDELRVSFSVSRGISGSANSFSLKIWNLNANHRNSVGKELDSVQIEAGYLPPEGGGNVGIIALGAVRDVQHERNGPDIITTISCGDGDRAYRRATISKTIPKGALVSEVVEALYAELEKQGIKRGEWKFPEDLRTLKRPYSMCGSCVRELNVLGRGNRFYWSIQNETLEIIPSDGYLSGAVFLSARSGLINTPTLTDNGVKLKALLNPDIRPNRLVQVQSAVLEMNSQEDTYRVSQVDFNGDNMQGDFIVDIHGEAISNGRVDEGVRP